ncbi:MAG: sorbosone dehydrogenase family protein [Bacteroidota bacterium]
MKNRTPGNVVNFMLLACPKLVGSFCILLGVSVAGFTQVKDSLPQPFATKSAINFSRAIGWKNGRTPTAPPGFKVTLYANGFENPRWMYVTSNGDILVAESNSNYNIWEQIAGTILGAAKSKNLSHSKDRIILLRDTDKDGFPDFRDTFLTAKSGLEQPFGMLQIGNWLYVANTNAILRYPYNPGDSKITAVAQKIADLPAGKHNKHWTKNIITNAGQSKLYVAIGSASNALGHGINEEILRACILEMNLDGTGQRVYADGLRNPVGMDWAPGTNTLWTVVNERDRLGDDLVPDFFTSVKDGGFYGWPYVYWGQHRDPRVKDQELAKVKNTIIPDIDMGSHNACLGLAFYTKNKFPERYRNGAFIAEHGSSNRKVLSGYRVVFVPFKNGKPSGPPEDFLQGFIADLKKDRVYGRPVGVTLLPEGSMLVTDDFSNIIWRVDYGE